MQRILVIGPGGAGKTTFSDSLGRVLGLPVVHLDALYWRSGWQPSAPDEWQRTVDEATKAPEWVMDGNYGGTMEARVAAAEAIVFLDVPRNICIARVLWRRLKYAGRSRPSMPIGCPERLTWQFLHWIWTFKTRKRPRVLALLEGVRKEKTVVILRSSRESEKYLVRLSA
jgi:adenylate kinase family enzyme